MILSEERND